MPSTPRPAKYRLLSRTLAHPWTSELGWITETWLIDSEQDAELLRHWAAGEGWIIWLLGYAGQPAMVVYRKWGEYDADDCETYYHLPEGMDKACLSAHGWNYLRATVAKTRAQLDQVMLDIKNDVFEEEPYTLCEQSMQQLREVCREGMRRLGG